MSWGGARVGAGRKRKDGVVAFRHGSRQRAARAAPLAVVPGPVPHLEPPADLPPDQLAVWHALAPLAETMATLTPATVESFRDGCRAIVIRNGLFAKIQEDGWTYITVKTDPDGNTHEEIKRHPLVTDLRGWEQRVEAFRARFLLAPMGKPLVVSKPADPFAEFEAYG